MVSETHTDTLMQKIGKIQLRFTDVTLSSLGHLLLTKSSVLDFARKMQCFLAESLDLLNSNYAFFRNRIFSRPPKNCEKCENVWLTKLSRLRIFILPKSSHLRNMMHFAEYSSHG